MTFDDRLLIVIPCLNEEARLPSLLRQFTRENPQALVVIADGGSSDGSRDLVLNWNSNAPNVVLLDNPRKLQGAGINLSVSKYGSGRDWLLRVDAHADYPANFARTLIEAARARAAENVVVPMVSRGITCFQMAAAAAQNSVIGTGGSPHRHVSSGRFVDHGHHALMRLDLFMAAGGYLEDMPANEDAELDARLTKLGARIWLEPGAAIAYYPRGHPLALWRQYYGYGGGRIRTLRLHGMRPKLRQLLPLLVPVAFVMAALAPITAWFAAPLIAWMIATLTIGLIVGLRTQGRCAWLAGGAAIIMHLAWGLGAARELLAFKRGGPPTDQTPGVIGGGARLRSK